MTADVDWINAKKESLERMIPPLRGKVAAKRLSGETILDNDAEADFQQRRIDLLDWAKGEMEVKRAEIETAEGAEIYQKHKAFQDESDKREILIREKIIELGNQLSDEEKTCICGNVRGMSFERIEIIAHLEDMMIALNMHPATRPDIDLWEALKELGVVNDG